MVLAFVWLKIAAAPLVGQPVLYAGGVILMFTPIMWLGFFLILLPSSLAVFRHEGGDFAANGLATLALLPLGCVLLTPGVSIVAGNYREKMVDETRDWERQRDTAKVAEVLEQGGDLRQFTTRSQATEQALAQILASSDASQLHVLASAYIDDSHLMESMAALSRDPEDLRSLFSHYRAAPPGERSVLTKLATNPNLPPDNRLAVLQSLMAGDLSERYVVADSPYATPGMLEALAADAEISVRIRVTRNPLTPTATLRVLTREKEVAVSGQALRALRDRQQPVR